MTGGRQIVPLITVAPILEPDVLGSPQPETTSALLQKDRKTDSEESDCESSESKTNSEATSSNSSTDVSSIPPSMPTLYSDNSARPVDAHQDRGLGRSRRGSKSVRFDVSEVEEIPEPQPFDDELGDTAETPQTVQLTPVLKRTVSRDPSLADRR